MLSESNNMRMLVLLNVTCQEQWFSDRGEDRWIGLVGWIVELSELWRSGCGGDFPEGDGMSSPRGDSAKRTLLHRFKMLRGDVLVELDKGMDALSDG